MQDNDYSSDNYKQLQALYKIKDVKGTIKKKTKTSLNYYAICGCVAAVVGLGVFYFKKISKKQK